MSTLAPVGPNAEQIRHWTESGPKWVALHERINAQIAPFGLRAMERAAFAPGERVLDVGCGCGATTIEIARRVGPAGLAAGVDVSAAMLERAGQAAHRAGVQIDFALSDAQTHPFEAARYDALFSRFGVMFFAQPEDAFRNLCGALRPGGRFAFLCWRALQENAWMMVPLGAALRHVVPPPLPPSGAPGPFGLADADRVRAILLRAGFDDLGFEAIDDEVVVGGGGSLQEVVEFAMQIGPLGAVLRQTGADVRSLVVAAVREALEPYAGPDGVRLSAAMWLITGRKSL